MRPFTSARRPPTRRPTQARIRHGRARPLQWESLETRTLLTGTWTQLTYPMPAHTPDGSETMRSTTSRWSMKWRSLQRLAKPAAWNRRGVDTL